MIRIRDGMIYKVGSKEEINEYLARYKATPTKANGNICPTSRRCMCFKEACCYYVASGRAWNYKTVCTAMKEDKA